MDVMINIAEDFTRYPGGRYPEDGNGNGTSFRVKFLLPILEKKEHAKIVLDGVAGYPSSFLDEAFAGLVREHGYSSEQVLKAFTFVSNDESYHSYIEVIKEYVNKAARNGAVH